MSIAVNDLIADALVTAGELGIGEPIGADLLQSMLRRLNRLMDSWKLDPSLLYGVTNQTLPLATSTATYAQALLSGATRPDGVEYVYVTLTGSTVNYPVEVVSAQKYAAIQLKTTPGIPRLCYVDAGVTYAFTFWPVPYATMTATIGCAGPLTGGFAAGGTVTLPPGYDRMLVENLAMDLCASIGRPVSRELQLSAEKSMNLVRRGNREPRLLTYDLPGRGRSTYDIRGDR